MPPTSRTEPVTTRRREDESDSADWSEMAAMGEMRTARRAGLTADTTVTPMPMTSAATTVRGAKTRELVGRVTPKPLSRACSPTAARTPRPRPINEATRPTAAASPRTDRNTWRRLAPSTRSRASSRVRWPTMIEKVLKMVNPPTNSEMKAKINRAVEKNPRALLMVLDDSSATV